VARRFRRLLNPLAALLGVTGATAAVNRGLRAASAVPINHLGGTQQPWRVRGFESFATTRGEGAPIVFVHGIYTGASSYEFRKIFGTLAATHRSIAFDLLGCGLSAMPALDYSAELFVEQIVDAVDRLTGAPCTLVGSSLGAALAIRAALRAGDRVAQLVLVAPTGLEGVLAGPPSASQLAARTLLRSPVAGEAAFNALASRRSLRRYLQSQVYADPAAACEDVVAQLYAVSHQPGARFVPAAFIGGDLNCDVARDLPFLEAPILILWGEHASGVNPVANAAAYLRFAKRATLMTFGRSGLLPHEEEPEPVARAIAEFAA
jgi:pimeloyl-ACP methyl ester carboxylesterase